MFDMYRQICRGTCTYQQTFTNFQKRSFRKQNIGNEFDNGVNRKGKITVVQDIDAMLLSLKTFECILKFQEKI